VSTYEFLLFAHLVFVIAWLGTDIAIQFFYLRARIAGPDQVARFSGDVEWIGLRLLNPSSLLVLVFGVLLVIDQDAYGFGQFWVWIALVAFALSAGTGAGFLGPESGRIKALVESHGPDSPEVQRRIARVLTISRIELVILIAVVLDMVLKPGL
jgi:uncharacterized membrane protein